MCIVCVTLTSTTTAAPHHTTMGDEEATWDVSADVNWDDWGDDNGDGSSAGGPCIDLFNNTPYDSPKFAIDTMREAGFDLLDVARTHGCDQYGCIRMINYIRKKVSSTPRPPISTQAPPSGITISSSHSSVITCLCE